MKTPPSPPPLQSRVQAGYTEQDVCNYAHHLWVQSGMSFEGDPWAEARACLAANLPVATAPRPKRPAERPPRAQPRSPSRVEAGRRSLAVTPSS